MRSDVWDEVEEHVCCDSEGSEQSDQQVVACLGLFVWRRWPHDEAVSGMVDVPEGFDPESVRDIAKRLERAEMEETTSVVTSIEMGLEAATELVEAANEFREGNWSRTAELIAFALAFSDSVELCLDGEGILDDD